MKTTMPCRCLSDNVDDYVDCLDQLYEIVEKYRSSHIAILGGDMNEDLVLCGQITRGNHLEKFLAEAEMDTNLLPKLLLIQMEYLPLHWIMSFI